MVCIFHCKTDQDISDGHFSSLRIKAIIHWKENKVNSFQILSIVKHMYIETGWNGAAAVPGEKSKFHTISLINLRSLFFFFSEKWWSKCLPCAPREYFVGIKPDNVCENLLDIRKIYYYKYKRLLSHSHAHKVVTSYVFLKV